MAYEFLATINILRADSPEKHKFIPIGRILYDDVTEEARLFMTAFTTGWVVAFPRTTTQIEEHPYLHGDLFSMSGSYTKSFADGTAEVQTFKQKIGRIITGDNAEGQTTYSIELFCIPAKSKIVGEPGVWIKVERE